MGFRVWGLGFLGSCLEFRVRRPWRRVGWFLVFHTPKKGGGGGRLGGRCTTFSWRTARKRTDHRRFTTGVGAPLVTPEGSALEGRKTTCSNLPAHLPPPPQPPPTPPPPPHRDLSLGVERFRASWVGGLSRTLLSFCSWDRWGGVEAQACICSDYDASFSRRDSNENLTELGILAKL